METTTHQDDLSSTANHSFSGDGTASKESGWTSYIDYFMETQRRQKEASNDDSSSTSGYDGGHCVAGAGSRASSFAEEPRLPALVEPSLEASRRLKKVRRRKKVNLYDESLEDTATSPISRPKLTELRDSDANHQSKNGAFDEISHSKKTATDGEFDCASYINSGAKTNADVVNIDDGNELKKKGLCLVPVSVFHA